MLKDGTEDGTGEIEDGTAKTGVVKNQDGRCLVAALTVDQWRSVILMKCHMAVSAQHPVTEFRHKA